MNNNELERRTEKPLEKKSKLLLEQKVENLSNLLGPNQSLFSLSIVGALNLYF